MSDEPKTGGLTEGLTEKKLDPATIKRLRLFTICAPSVVDDHIEINCGTIEAAKELADLLEKEIVIRIKPKVTEETKHASTVETKA